MPPKNIYRSRKVVSCKYCFYEKNDECRLSVCPYVAERITAKVRWRIAPVQDGSP